MDSYDSIRLKRVLYAHTYTHGIFTDPLQSFLKTAPHPFTYMGQYLFALPLYLNTAGLVSMVSASRVWHVDTLSHAHVSTGYVPVSGTTWSKDVASDIWLTLPNSSVRGLHGPAAPQAGTAHPRCQLPRACEQRG